MTMDRRNFVHLLGAGALTTLFPPSIGRALAIPAHHRTGTIDDVEHIVILMQENRSFDHYFGTLRGVRGFGDPRAVQLPSGASVWQQPNGSGQLLPFHPTAPNLGLQFIEDLPHGWTDTHRAWNQGKYDQWVASKGTTTMAYLERADIPGATASDRVLFVLGRVTRSLQRYPELTEAMTRAFMFADASAAAEVDTVGRLMEQMFANAMSEGGEPTPENLAVARVIGDVWLSQLVAWVTRRASASDVSARLELTARLLLR
jgi:hypothetical protein